MQSGLLPKLALQVKRNEERELVAKVLGRRLRTPRYMLVLPLVLFSLAIGSVIYCRWWGNMGTYEMFVDPHVTQAYALTYIWIMTAIAERACSLFSGATKRSEGELRALLVTPIETPVLLSALVRSTWLPVFALGAVLAAINVVTRLIAFQAEYAVGSPVVDSTVLRALQADSLKYLLATLLLSGLAGILWALVSVLVFGRLPALWRTGCAALGACGLAYANYVFYNGHLISEVDGYLFCAAIVIVPTLLLFVSIRHATSFTVANVLVTLLVACGVALVIYGNLPVGYFDPDSDGCVTALLAFSPWNRFAVQYPDQTGYLPGSVYAGSYRGAYSSDEWDFFLPTLAFQLLWLAALRPLAAQSIDAMRAPQTR